jgi:hypothetical protein
LSSLLISREESVYESLLDYHGDILKQSADFVTTVTRGRSAHNAEFISIQAYGYGWSILRRI